MYEPIPLILQVRPDGLTWHIIKLKRELQTRLFEAGAGESISPNLLNHPTLKPKHHYDLDMMNITKATSDETKFESRW